jgi:hypothetical protein
MYDEGGWAAWRIEEDVLEDLDREGITQPVAVIQWDGAAVLFWVTERGVKL